MDEYIPLGDIRLIFRIYIINEEICRKTMQIHLTNKKAVQLEWYQLSYQELAEFKKW